MAWVIAAAVYAAIVAGALIIARANHLPDPTDTTEDQP